MQTSKNLFHQLALIATLLAFVVVILGAFTRLTDAGLGCPDWPGCYGQLTVPQSEQALAQAAESYPGQTVEPAKAWAEMVHRYIAGSLGLFIFTLAGMAIYQRKQAGQPVFLPLALVGLVIFQAVLGMWTVTLLLLPLVVMGHLMGGMSILASLWWLALRVFNAPTQRQPQFKKYLPWALLGFVFIYLQIALGGWTGANYSALACPDFPFCQGKLIPEMDLAAAFNFSHPVGVNYDGGVLNNTARITINSVHRFFAVFVGLYCLGFAIACIWQRASMAIHSLGLWFGCVLIMQITLGIINITHLAPLAVAVLHNAFGAILLLTMLAIIHRLKLTGWGTRHD